jgi:hypothetical protein
MLKPLNERQSLEQELVEIAGQIAANRQEFENGRPYKARREPVEWQIHERERRLAEVRARLRGLPPRSKTDSPRAGPSASSMRV